MAATQKPGQAPAKGKKSKRNESQESAQAARERKREAKRKGLKPGSRQGAEQGGAGHNSGTGPKDPRIGSRKPVVLVVEAQAKPVVAKPEKTPEQLAEQQARQHRLKLEQELATLENDERLNTLLDRLDEELTISAADEAWLEEMLDRHQVLLSELGIEDEDDDEEPSSPEELLQRFIEDDFDPSEINPEYKPGKK